MDWEGRHPVTVTLCCIETAQPRRYTVTIADGEERREFSFRVELHRGIEIVQSDLEFDRFFGFQRSGGDLIVKAVLAFHNAQPGEKIE